MAGSKKGERRGRKPGSRNKRTIEQEQRALQELAEQARSSTRAGRKITIAKDELLELIPVLKGTVAQFQQAAIADGKGLPGGDKFDRNLWKDLKEWVEVYANVCRYTAEFQSPKYRAIAVAMQDPGAQRAPEPKVIEAPTDAIGRERLASAAYLKLVKG